MLVITLTSWTKRIGNIIPTLESCLNQTCKPDRIYLQLSKTEFEGVKIDPKVLDFINENNIILNWVDEPNTKAFKKVLPILDKLNDNDLIVNLDDDVILKPNILETYKKEYEKRQTPLRFGGAQIFQDILPGYKYWGSAVTFFAKKHLKHWDELIDNEILMGKHDDCFYNFMFWLNGYVVESICKDKTCGFTLDGDQVAPLTNGTPWQIIKAEAAENLKFLINKFKNKFNQEAKFGFFRQKFIMIDRGTSAEDCSEYFYRHLQKNNPELEIRYILSNKSLDWDRLQKDNFNLVPLEDTELIKKELIDCDNLCFSFYPNDIKGFPISAIQENTKKVFLFHGIINHPAHYVTKHSDKYDMITISANIEKDEFEKDEFYTNEKSKYRLTGSPRHDSLINRNKKEKQEDAILVQTWWRWWMPKDNNQAKYKASKLYRDMLELFEHPRLKELCDKYNFRLYFKLHPMAYKYFDCYKGNSCVDIRKNEESFEDLFVKCKAIITDLSSNFYEMAVIDKPCIHFLPDWNELQKMTATDSPRIDLNKKGLGPVVYSVDKLLDEIEKLVKNNYVDDKLYQQRRKTEMVYLNNANNCKRILQEIFKLQITTTQNIANTDITSSRAESNYNNTIKNNKDNRADGKANCYLYF